MPNPVLVVPGVDEAGMVSLTGLQRPSVKVIGVPVRQARAWFRIRNQPSGNSCFDFFHLQELGSIGLGSVGLLFGYEKQVFILVCLLVRLSWLVSCRLLVDRFQLSYYLICVLSSLLVRANGAIRRSGEIQ
jgi:hypothetical protein